MFTVIYKDEKVQELTKRIRGSEIECEFSLDQITAKKPASLRLVIEVKKKKMCFNRKLLFTEKYSLAQLKNNPQIKKGFRIDKHKFDLSVYFKKDDEEIKQSIVETQADSVKVLKIVNEREPFVPTEQEVIYEYSEHPVKKASLSRVEEFKKPTEKVDSSLPIPEGLAQDEIEDPDVQRNLASLLYCTEKHKKLNQAIQSAIASKTKISDEVRQKFLLLHKQKTGIESAIQNEQVSFEQYMGYLQKSLEHDKVLFDYFTQSGMTEKANTVRFRMECTQKEINQEVDEDAEGDEE